MASNLERSKKRGGSPAHFNGRGGPIEEAKKRHYLRKRFNDVERKARYRREEGGRRGSLSREGEDGIPVAGPNVPTGSEAERKGVTLTS